LTEPPSLTLSTAEETATEEMLSAARLRLDSLPSRPTDSLRSGPTEGGLAWIAEEEFNITKTFLESHSTSVTHEQFMHSMLQAHDQSDPFEKMVIYNRLLSSIHPRIEHEPPPQQNEGVALPPPKRKRRKNKDFTAHASGSAVRDEDLDVLSGF
jgi:hypothetical protein